MSSPVYPVYPEDMIRQMRQMYPVIKDLDALRVRPSLVSHICYKVYEICGMLNLRQDVVELPATLTSPGGRRISNFYGQDTCGLLASWVAVDNANFVPIEIISGKKYKRQVAHIFGNDEKFTDVLLLFGCVDRERWKTVEHTFQQHSIIRSAGKDHWGPSWL